MCKKKQFKYCPSEIDECMKNLIEILRARGVRTLSCCCGHRRYPMTIIIEQGLETQTYALEIMSDKVIPRKKKFYKKDKQGYYYIPEVDMKC